MITKAFRILCVTLPGQSGASIAIAASRAGEPGIVDLSFARDEAAALEAIASLDRHGRGDRGVKLDPRDVEFSSRILRHLPEGIRIVVLAACDEERIAESVRLLRRDGLTLLQEVTTLEQALAAQLAGVDGIVARGHEAGGAVQEETTFILLQRLLGRVTVPVYAHGGIGLHTAAACRAAGAAGVVLDAQLALTRESTLPEEARSAIARMDGSETIVLGAEAGETFRVYSQPGLRVLDELRAEIRTLVESGSPAAETSPAWRAAVARRVGWGPATESLWLLGQDAAFAASLARRFKTVGGVIDAMHRAVDSHLEAARRLRPLDQDSPLARSHATAYPIVQGPMTRVSDVAGFAHAVAQGGGLPMLALALLRGPQVKTLLEETRDLLGERPWGVGILGFVPLELRQEQLEMVRSIKPKFALIAGGRPDQARALEQDGIPTYLHVPSPGLLKLFLENGSRRFVFEGRECGGHVGPRSSFVLWNTMIDVLLENLPAGDSESCHVLFAAGIHDALSASMVAALAAPLAERGCRIGALLGTAYLFTHEAVATKAILPGFQEEAVRCSRTVLLETGPGHSTRCAETDFAAAFQAEKRRLLAEGRSAEEIRAALEELNLGRLRIASKGVARASAAEAVAAGKRYQSLDDGEQRRQGMYMIGQVAALRDRTCSIEELHRDVSVAGSERLALVAPAAEVRDARPAEKPSDVAIVGMGCLLPKAPDLQTYWENILNKVDAVTEIPADRWDWRLYFDADPNKRDKIYSRWGGFLDDVAFDPMRYGMPPNSLPSIEPLQLLVLETVRAALDDAGYLDRPFNRKTTSVILGAGGGVADLGNQYGMRAGLPLYVDDIPAETLARLPEWTEDSFAGILLNVAAGRVANRFDLGGSNFTVDAACASSLAAVYLATRELETRNADMVIVGGADTVQNPFGYLCFSKTKALSPRGRCSTFDESADGIVISEGITVLVLKRLADAERDGDRIYAVIKGVASSSDGRDKGLTAPRREGQILALERAYARAGYSPATVGLIEAHGTGTVAGDQAEIEALKRVFDAASADRQGTAVGSVKSMIGHTKCTAGVASLAKTALALHHKVLPPTLNVEKPNPKARFSESPFYVNAELRPWLKGATDTPRRAGVSSFGFGGTNFHVALEEYADEVPMPAREAVARRRRPETFLFRGGSRQEVLTQVADLVQTLGRGARPDAADLAFSLWRRARARNGNSLTLAIVAASLDDFSKKLASARDRLADGAASIADPSGVYYSETPLARDGRIAFLFPGQGSQYPNMLRELAVHFPEVRGSFERAEKTLAGRLAKPLGRYVFPPPAFTPQEEQAQQQALTATDVAQPALGAAGMAMFRLLETLGIRPDVAAGHSYGEYAALCAAASFDEATLAVLSEARGRCIVEAARQELGTMAAVSEGREKIDQALGNQRDVWIANLNAPRQTVISGTRQGIEEAIERLKTHGIQARTFPVACAFHSPLVAAARDRFGQVLASHAFADPKIEVFSNTTAMPYPKDGKAVGTLLTEHLVSPVLFADQIEAMHAAGARLFVEVGPRNVLTGLVQQILGDRPYLALASDVAGRSGLLQLAHALAQLAAQGAPVKLDRLFEGRALREMKIENLEEETREKELPATTWMVNGGRSRPRRALTTAAQPIAARAATPTAPLAATAAATAAPIPSPAAPASVVAAPRATALGVPVAAPVTSPAAAPALAVSTAIVPAQPAPSLAASATTRDPGQLPVGDAMAQVMLQFQGVMNRFLETQKSVMLAALHGGVPAGVATDSPAVASQPILLPSHAAVEPAAVQLVALAPVAVAPAPQPLVAAAPMPAAAPIVVAAAVVAAIPAAAPAVETASAMATPANDAADPARLQREVFQVVSERTGYPPDMLRLDVDMEAELGIDSIKRVEIFGTLQRALLPPERAADQKAMERLTATRTLRGVVDWFVQALGGGAIAPAPAVPATAVSVSAVPLPAAPEAIPAPAAVAERTETAALVETAPRMAAAPAQEIPRFRIVTIDKPMPETAPFPFAADRLYILTDDESGVAAALAEKIKASGGRAALVRSNGAGVIPAPGDVFHADLSDPKTVHELVETLRRNYGPIEGIVHLLPFGGRAAFDVLDLATWKTRVRLEVKSLYLLARAAGADLKSAGAGRAFVLAATAMGGDSGLSGADGAVFPPGQGGVSGFLKTLSHDWPTIRCRAVDFEPGADATRVASALLNEIALVEEEPEIGHVGARRIAFRVAPAPLDDVDRLPIDRDTVILVTGGARGITAEVAAELAECYRPVLILAGRSPLPPAEEPAATRGLVSQPQIKAAIMETMRGQGETVGLPRVEAAYQTLLKEREIRGNMARIEKTGAVVRYVQADVRDERALRALVEEIHATHGRLDGVIHGAGIIEDKLVDDKTPESFDRVFDTKVDSAFILARALRPETLKFLVFFASVAGSFPSRGQSDYAAANEVLNRLALRLNRSWPGRVVSINWGPWGTTGMASPEVQKQFQKRGVQIIPPPAGRVLLNLELRHGRKEDSRVVIGDGPWSRLAVAPQAATGAATAALAAGDASSAELPLLRGLTPARGVGEAIELVKTFVLSNDLYLEDHVLDGKPVVPAAVALELIAEAAQRGWPDLQVSAVRDFAVLKGLVLEDSTRSVKVAARASVEPPHDRVGVDVQVEITDASPGGVPRYRAVVEMSDRPPALADVSSTPADLGPFPRPLADVYRDWLFHGPIFQGIETAHGLSEKGMLATCVPSTPALCLAGSPAGSWLVDPVVFDSALQMAVIWSRAYLDMTPLPTRFRRYRRFGSLSEGKILCDMRITSRPHPHSFVIDIRFTASDGRLIGLLEGMECACSPAMNRLAGSHLRWRAAAAAASTSTGEPLARSEQTGGDRS